MSNAGSSDHKEDAIQPVPTERAGQTNVPPGAESSYTLVVFVNDHPGAVDRVIGLLRRRRASMQKLLVGRSELPDVVRITVSVTDSAAALAPVGEVRLSAGCAASTSSAPSTATDAPVSVTFMLRPPGVPDRARGRPVT